VISSTLLALAFVQGEAGVLPANPVSPLLVASGGTTAASARIAGVHLNPANGSAINSIELAVVAYPRTGLEGFSVVAAGGRRLRFIAGLWAYSMTEIFDEDLIAQDPSLRDLGLSMAAGSLGSAIRVGRLSFGTAFTARTQTIVGTHTSSTSISTGVRLVLGYLEFSAAFADIALGNTQSTTSPDGTVSFGAATTYRVATVTTRLEINAVRPNGESRRWTLGLSPSLTWGPLELILGYSASGGWSGGASFRHERLRFEAATNFVGSQRLDQRVALGLSIQ
jgi:hypothetical protein